MKILDSDHWIALLRGRLDLRGRVGADEELAITAISVGELVYGAERSARRDETLLALDTLLAGLTVLAYDEQAGHRFGALKAELERHGERLADADLQIAAVVLSHGAPPCHPQPASLQPHRRLVPRGLAGLVARKTTYAHCRHCRHRPLHPRPSA